MTVFLVRKVFAGFGERGTAAVEAVCVVNLFAAGLREKTLVEGYTKGRNAYSFAIPAYPSWYDYAG